MVDGARRAAFRGRDRTRSHLGARRRRPAAGRRRRPAPAARWPAGYGLIPWVRRAGRRDSAGRAVAEALIRAFPDHFECQAPGDEACLERLQAKGRTSSNPLCGLVRDNGIAPEDALPVGLSILAALADLARTSAFSVLDASA